MCSYKSTVIMIDYSHLDTNCTDPDLSTNTESDLTHNKPTVTLPDVPSQTPSYLATQTTSFGPMDSQLSQVNNNIGLIAGAIVAIIIVLLGIVTAIVLVVILLLVKAR